MRNAPIIPINAGSNAGNLVSPAFDLKLIFQLSFQGVLTDNTATGTLKLQVSNDHSNPTNWFDLPVGAASALPSVTNSAGIVSFGSGVLAVAHTWGRLVWTRSAGAGTLTASANLAGA